MNKAVLALGVVLLVPSITPAQESITFGEWNVGIELFEGLIQRSPFSEVRQLNEWRDQKKVRVWFNKKQLVAGGECAETYMSGTGIPIVEFNLYFLTDDRRFSEQQRQLNLWHEYAHLAIWFAEPHDLQPSWNSVGVKLRFANELRVRCSEAQQAITQGWADQQRYYQIYKNDGLAVAVRYLTERYAQLSEYRNFGQELEEAAQNFIENPKCNIPREP